MPMGTAVSAVATLQHCRQAANVSMASAMHGNFNLCSRAGNGVDSGGGHGVTAVAT